ADEAQSGAARSDPADDLQLDADHLHFHAGKFPGRAGDLLGLEQHALGHAAERDHAPERRQDRIVGQSQTHLYKAEAKTAGGVGRLLYPCNLMEWMPALVAAFTFQVPHRPTIEPTLRLPAMPLEFANQRGDNTLG